MKYSKEERRLARQVLVKNVLSKEQPGQLQREQVNSRRMVSEVSWGFRPRPHGPLIPLGFGLSSGEAQQRPRSHSCIGPLCPLGGKEHKKEGRQGDQVGGCCTDVGEEWC